MPSTDDATLPATARDERREELVGRIRADLGDRVVDTFIRPGDDLWVRVRTDAWRATAEVFRHRLGFEYFCYLSAIDWMPSPYGRGEDDPTEPPQERPTAVVPGYTGGDTRFQLLARLYDVTHKIGVTLKADVPEAMIVDTWVPVYAGAAWHERETWEMFGIVFVGHPDLRHIYLPGDFEGFPLRKDFPLIARMVKPWPGIVDVEPMPGEPEGEEEP